MPTSTTARPLPALLVACAFLATGAVLAPAAAQTVRGTLVQHPDGAPLPGGTVVLVDAAGSAVDSTRAAADGAFTLRAPEAGVHLLQFSHPGYASVPSDPLRLETDETVTHRFAVPLISGAALRRMAEVVDVEARLQSDIVELCGERPRSWEAGILVGVVRRHRAGEPLDPAAEPLPGAVVRVDAPAPDGGEPFHKATVSSANGVYVLCNVPPGVATARTELAGYRTDVGPVEVHAGNVGWYDVYLRPL